MSIECFEIAINFNTLWKWLTSIVKTEVNFKNNLVKIYSSVINSRTSLTRVIISKWKRLIKAPSLLHCNIKSECAPHGTSFVKGKWKWNKFYRCIHDINITQLNTPDFPLPPVNSSDYADSILPIKHIYICCSTLASEIERLCYWM